MIILPGHPLFDITLATPPPDWRYKQERTCEPLNFVKDSVTGIFRTANPEELDDYLYGGEYDELMPESKDEYGEWEYDMD